MRSVPHVERLARLLHNRLVRRVLHAHPDATALLAVGDLDDGAVVLRPVAAWDAAGSVLGGGAGTSDGAGGAAAAGAAATATWQVLLDDLRADLLLLGRVSPVELFVPYVLDLRQLDLRLETDEAAGQQRSY